MHLKNYAALFASVALLAGCSQKGTVVEKRLKPSPFAYSAGVNAIYSFMLRDSQGHVHSQMVPAEVFERYEVGDYFDDQQAGPARRESGFSKESAVSDSKDVRPVKHASARTKKHHTAARKTAAKRKHRNLRAVARHREEDPRPATVTETTAVPTAGVTLRTPNPEPQGLDVRP